MYATLLVNTQGMRGFILVQALSLTVIKRRVYVRVLEKVYNQDRKARSFFSNEGFNALIVSLAPGSPPYISRGYKGKQNVYLLPSCGRPIPSLGYS